MGNKVFSCKEQKKNCEENIDEKVGGLGGFQARIRRRRFLFEEEKSQRRKVKIRSVVVGG